MLTAPPEFSYIFSRNLSFSRAVSGDLAISVAHSVLDWTMADGERLWHGAKEALKLVEEGRLAVEGRRLLELGCGLGVLGLACAVRGARQVLLTDYDPELLKACATWATGLGH